MSIAVDQTKLRRIVHTILPSASLDPLQAQTIIEFAQLAAGVSRGDDPMEHSIMQAVAQHVGSLAGMQPGDLLPIQRLPDEESRRHWFGSLAAQLETRGARELAYVCAFLVSVADLELTEAERNSLDELQSVLGLEDRRATDLMILVTETVAAESAA